MPKNSNGSLLPNCIIGGGICEIVTSPRNFIEQRLRASTFPKRYVCRFDKTRLRHEIHMVCNTFIVIAFDFRIFSDNAMRTINC